MQEYSISILIERMANMAENEVNVDADSTEVLDFRLH